MEWDIQIGKSYSIAGISCRRRCRVELATSPIEKWPEQAPGALEQSHAICSGGTHAFLKTTPAKPLDLGGDRMPEREIRAAHQELAPIKFPDSQSSATTDDKVQVIHSGSSINTKVAQAHMVPTTVVPRCLSERTPMSLWESPYDQLKEEEKARVWFTDELALYVGTLPSEIGLNNDSETKSFQREELWELHLVTHFLCWKEKRSKLRINMDA